MNLWIETARDSLVRTIGGVDLVFMNDAEMRMLTEEPNLRARGARGHARWARAIVVAKQGEYGAALFTGRGLLRPARLPARDRDRPDRRRRLVRRRLPRLPRLAGEDRSTTPTLRRAMTYGSVLASFNVEEFGTERVSRG